MKLFLFTRHFVRIRSIPIAAALVVLGWTVADSAPLFRSNYVSFAGSVFPSDAAVADLNGDGSDDIAVVTSFETDSLALYLSTSDGSFSVIMIDPQLAPIYRKVWAADLDLDGDVDLVNGSSLEFSVMLGHGDGTFDAPVVHASGGATSPVVADLDEDGLPDIVLVHYDDGTVVIHPGTGGGALGAPVAFPAGPEPYFLRVGDVDENGHLDVVVAGGTGYQVLLALGGGAFALPVAFGPGGNFLLADATGDGHLDVVTDSLVLAGAGDGTFLVSLPLALTPCAVADFDGDGVADVAGTFARPGLGRIIGLQSGMGDGAFGLLTLHQAPIGIYAYLTRAGDFDGDGRLDLASPSYTWGALDVHYGNGDGTFGSGGSHACTPGPYRVALADLDHDGKLDVVVGGSGLSILRGSGSASLGSSIDYPTPAGVVQMVTGDFDGDGDPDVAFTSGLVSVRLGNGDGTLGSSVDYWTGTGCNGIAVGDLDGDGDLDLATANNTASARVSLLFGNGDGTFQDPQALAGNTSRALAIAVGDMNHDDKPDIVDNGDGAMVVRLGDGAGGFAPGVVSSYDGSYTRKLSLADVNEDGDVDVVARINSQIYLWLGTGGGALAPATIAYSLKYRADDLALADMNGDGHVDCVTARPPIGAAGVLFGHGDGTFGPEEYYGFAGSSVSPGGVEMGDMDGNGAPDIVLLCYQQSLVGVMLNRLGPQLAVPPIRGHAGLALIDARPNPAGSVVRVAVRLAEATPARLDLFDLSGRRCRSRDLGKLPAGEHLVDLGGGAGLRAGLYFLRLSQGDRVATGRVSIVR